MKIFNHVNVVDFLLDDGKVLGTYGFSTREKIFYSFTAKVTLITTGGASRIYLPNHAGGSRHQMWYPPFNTGAGDAMGIRAGAEMTTFEMRFVALRCKTYKLKLTTAEVEATVEKIIRTVDASTLAVKKMLAN